VHIDWINIYEFYWSDNVTKGFLKGLGMRLEMCTFAGVLVGALYSPLVVAIWFNDQFEEVGEGYKVRELGDQRQFYVGDDMGLARLCVDENKDGTLDKTFRNMPISSMMGGPGYRLMEVETTAEDRKRFERANYLLAHMNDTK
jgi:hypothetical protein